MNGGFILLYRQITEWEWYQNPNTFRVFLHCLLMANFADGRFEGLDVKRGQFVTSLPSLSKQTKLTIQQVRTALDHLKSTGEITDKTYPKYRVITVVKYNDYQQDNRQINSQSTGNQQASNRQVTGNQQQYNNNNNGTMEKGNNGYRPLMDEDDAQGIQHDHDRVLNAAEDAGFKMSNDVRAKLIALYADNGMEKMLEGFRACVDHAAPNLAYLKAVLKGEPRKPVPVKGTVPAQAYTQRSYDGEQEAAMRRMIGQRKVMPAQQFSQRDYSGEDEDAINRMLAMGENDPGGAASAGA